MCCVMGATEGIQGTYSGSREDVFHWRGQQSFYFPGKRG